MRKNHAISLALKILPGKQKNQSQGNNGIVGIKEKKAGPGMSGGYT